MKPRLAMLAYACDPAGSGEHWLGWGWAEAAAQFADVTLIAPSKAKAAIEQQAPPLGISVKFVDLPGWLRFCSDHFGAAGSWWRKIAWAKKAARSLADRRHEFSHVHQTTFHTFRVPFYAASLGLPSIWGPIAGGECTPPGFDEILGEAAAAERKRKRQNERWREWSSVQRALRDAGQIFVSNRTTLQFLPDEVHSKAIVVPPNTIREALPQIEPRTRKNGELRLLYAGNCVATRGLPLAFRAMQGASGVKLTVAGAGPVLGAWREEAASLGVPVDFLGQIKREILERLYTECDALVFPALRDSGGSALLEAMSLGMPVVCLDWAGPGEMVAGETGIKIAVESPAQVVSALREAFETLRDDPTLCAKLGANARVRVNEHFTWSAKRRILEEACRRTLDR